MLDFTLNGCSVKPMYGVNLLPTAASLILTEDCNLACTYCFEKHSKKKMTIDVAKKALDFLFNNAIVNNIGEEVNVTMFGGEPTLAPKTIKAIFEYGSGLSIKYNVRFAVSVITNATILTNELYSIFNRYKNECNLNIQLSVDGIKEVQDMARITKDGSGSYEMVLKNIPMYKELFKDNPNRLSIHGCLNRETMPFLYESFLQFREVWGIERIWFLPVCEIPWEDVDIKIYQEQMGKIYDYIIGKVKQSNALNEVHFYAPLNRVLDNNDTRGVPCGAGKNYCTVTTDGEVYPCHQFYFHDKISKETLIGDIWNGIDEDKRRLYTEYEDGDMDCKKTCTHKSCYRCIAVNYEVNGSILSQVQGKYCDLMQVDKFYQEKLRAGLIDMGLLENKNNRDNVGNNDCRSHSPILLPGQKCDVVTSDCSANNGMRSPTKVINTDPSGSRVLLETWEDEYSFYEKFANPDGTFSVFDTPKTNPSTKASKSCNCGDKKVADSCCSEKNDSPLNLSDDLATISEALRILLTDVKEIKELQKEQSSLLNKIFK